ncbi:TPA: flavodoxin family protein [Candidatus Saccharibacteria bacterium]|nr:flavodoxin family protein [Candidatus Saccharibacteria bacterium]HIO87294.1 flavodoxin family protein [Candidatus Saccharibacteria bacterium]
MSQFNDLSAVFINCSLKRDGNDSHTQLLMNRAIGIMEAEGVSVETIHALDHTIDTGMIKDGSEFGRTDDWPAIQKKILQADILVLGTPIWLGVKSSVCTQVIERMYAYSGDRNDKGQYVYYGKTAGCVITGNEDGVKHCAMDILYAMSHIGYTIPPQADSGWIGEAGPGGSYGDTEFGDQTFDKPLGYDNDFTNRNTTFMAWNLMHTARMLKDAGGMPAKGNVAEDWQNATNAKDQNPEYR